MWAGIPKYHIQWLVGKYHVGTPPLVVALRIGRRCEGADWTRKKRRVAMKWALICHARNLKLYKQVMGGGW